MQDEFSPFRGGESEALKRLKESINNKVLMFNLALYSYLLIKCHLI